MVIDRERFLLLAAALSASQIGRASADVTAPPASAVATASSLSAPTNAPRGFCEEVAQRNDLLLAQPSGWCEGLAGEIEALRAEVATQRTTAPFLHYCHKGKGTWAVMLSSVALMGPAGESSSCGWTASYKLVFQPTPTTPLHECAVSLPHAWTKSRDEDSDVTNEIAFDYNGDGKDELILAHQESVNGEGTRSYVELVRGDGPRDRVVPYDVGFAFNGVVDADRDGRPDLLAGAHFHAETACGLGSHQVYGMPLLVHSLADGSFSMSDAVTRRWALSQCPTPMSASVEGNACEWNASCQRLWGRSEAEVNARAVTAPECAEGRECLRGTVAPIFAAAPLPWKPLNASPPTPLAPAKWIVAPPLRD